MLHHGADPSEMDKKVLSALLNQCCARCRTRYAALTHNGDDSRECMMRSYDINGFEELGEMDFDLELGDEMADNPGWPITN